MPLTPSPNPTVTLEHTLDTIQIAQWSDYEQRTVYMHIDEDHAEFICLEELDELIEALIRQRQWMAG